MSKFLSFFLVLLCSTLFLPSCQNNPQKEDKTYVCPMHCEGEKTYTDPGDCPVCNMKLVDETSLETTEKNEAGNISDVSIFNLTSAWQTQQNKTIALKDLNGHPFILCMIYTTCKAACPRLVADMKSISQKINRKDFKYVLVSIDPVNDTPEALATFAEANQLPADQWVLLQGTEEDVREISNVLAVKYMRISPLDFSHSNIISLFNVSGEMVYQQEGLGVDNANLVAEAKNLAR